MDSITQATLGAAVGYAVLGKKWGRKAALIGAVTGTLPDLDVVLLPFFDELQKISIHRGFSHSILFSVVGGLVIAYFLKRITWSRETHFARIFLLTFLGLFTHILLDTFTTYGTQLFLPFSDLRVSWDSITIFDPLYTLPLLIGLFWSVFILKRTSKYNALPNQLGMVVSSLYLLFTLVHKGYVEKEIDRQLTLQDIKYDQMLSVPVVIGNVTWYGVVRDDTNLYLGKYNALSDNNIKFEAFPINDDLLEGLNPYLIDRMKWFAQDFYTILEADGKLRFYNLQCDMQGVRTIGDYRAPTAFFYEIDPLPNGNYKLTSGVHPKENGEK